MCSCIYKITTMSENNLDEFEIVPSDLDSPIDFAIKHPLEHCWTLWYYENDRQNTWERNLREIASFETIEDFWALYNHIKLPSDLKHGCDYSLFKKGIKPMWEDDANKYGGRWLVNLEKRQRISDLDRYWLEILLLLIGGTLRNYSDQVCGVTVNIRGKGDKIGLWTSDAKNENAALEIGRRLKEQLHIAPKLIIAYQIHKDTMDKSGSSTKNTYTV